MEPSATKVWYLKKIDLFSGLSPEEMAGLERMTSMKVREKGEPIFHEGDPSDSVYLLKEGRVKILKYSPEGKELILDILGPGEVFGELALVDEGPRDSEALVLERALLCVIPRSEFERLLNERPLLAYRVTKLMGLRLKRVETQIADLAFRDVPARIAHLFLKLKEDGEDPALSLSLSQKDIANLIGASRELTTTTLNRFKREGIIDYSRRRYVILDEARLCRMLSEPAGRASFLAGRASKLRLQKGTQGHGSGQETHPLRRM